MTKVRGILPAAAAVLLLLAAPSQGQRWRTAADPPGTPDVETPPAVKEPAASPAPDKPPAGAPSTPPVAAPLDEPAPAPVDCPPGIEWRAKVLTASVLPREPVILSVTWHNKTETSVELPDDHALRLVVEKVGEGRKRGFWLRRRVRAEKPIPLKAGADFTRKVPMVLGKPGGPAAAPVEFILPAPGQYRISVAGAADGAALPVTVVEPSSEADRAAMALWTPAAARGMITDVRFEDTVAAAERICTECPESRYAAYAMWIWSANLARQGGWRNLKEASRWCEALLDRHPTFPLREETYRALIGVYDRVKLPDRAREAAADFITEFPGSEYVAAMRNRYGDDLILGRRAGLPAAGTPVPRATIRATGVEALPDGVRRAFEAYWRAVAQGDFDAVEGVLAGDFMGDAGRRGAHAPTLWKQRKGASAGAIRIAVTKGEPATVYERPISLPSGDARTWFGPLYIVRGVVAMEWVHARGGRTDSMQSPQACWVFHRYPKGTWKLVSETVPTRNLLAGAQGRALFAVLPHSITTWRISDGNRERSPYEEVKAQLGLTDKVLDDQVEWFNHTLIMAGPNRQEVDLLGGLRMPLKSSGASGKPTEWAERNVTLRLALGSDYKLVLKDVTVGPYVPQSRTINQNLGL